MASIAKLKILAIATNMLQILNNNRDSRDVTSVTC